jgi:hypothetical protein
MARESAAGSGFRKEVWRGGPPGAAQGEGEVTAAPPPRPGGPGPGARARRAQLFFYRERDAGLV